MSYRWVYSIVKILIHTMCIFLTIARRISMNYCLIYNDRIDSHNLKKCNVRYFLDLVSRLSIPFHFTLMIIDRQRQLPEIASMVTMWWHNSLCFIYPDAIAIDIHLKSFYIKIIVSIGMINTIITWLNNSERCCEARRRIQMRFDVCAMNLVKMCCYRCCYCCYNCFFFLIFVIVSWAFFDCIKISE